MLIWSVNTVIASGRELLNDWILMRLCLVFKEYSMTPIKRIGIHNVGYTTKDAREVQIVSAAPNKVRSIGSTPYDAAHARCSAPFGPCFFARPVRSCQVAPNLLPVLAKRPSSSSSSASWSSWYSSILGVLNSVVMKTIRYIAKREALAN